MAPANLHCMLITANPAIAQYAEQAGVQRIFIDMEVLGKAERQGHLNTHKAHHTYADISTLRAVLTQAELMVRLNPLHDGTPSEIDQAIAHGAQRLMLPMFHRRTEVRRFLDLVNGRVPVTLLTETPQALTRLPTYIADLGPTDQVHIGLNDLSLGMGLDFLFEPVAAGLLDPVADLLNQNDITWGFGGIARIGTGTLPAELVLSEHVRLGSGWVILSRAFHGEAATVEALCDRLDLKAELKKLWATETHLRQAGQATLQQNHQQFAAKTFALAAQIAPR